MHAAAAPAMPAVRSARRTLRVLGTASTLIPGLLQQARSDLGFDVEGIVLDGNLAHRTGVTAPESFDVYDQWFHNLEFVWTAHAIRPIEIDRIIRYRGAEAALNNCARAGGERRGGVPARLLYVQGDNRLGEAQSGRISMLPLTHCADSFGYRPEAMPEGFSQQTESWSWLVDRAWKRVVLQSNASIGAIDAILAVRAAGLLEVTDPGNLSLHEIDRLMSVLMDLRAAGHFLGFWSTQSDSADLFSRSRARIGSIWSSAMALPGLRHTPFRIAAPKEGYRGWYGGMALSRHLDRRTLDMAYDYMGWWLEGWPGAVVARQGYYFSVPEAARRHMAAAEWDYWYDGRPAASALPGVDGAELIPRGAVREGGSYDERMSAIAVWNSVMDEHNYLVRRWHDFVNYRR
jgi:putative spermidine/putrescine transport system substrate-binding protein